MLPYIFGLISAFCFGISNTYWKTAAKNSSFPALVFFRGLLVTSCFALTWLLLSVYNRETPLTINTGATTREYLLTVLLCIVCSFGLVFYLLSLKYSAVSLSVPLSSVNIFSILTAVFVLGEQFKSIYLFSFLLAITGVLISVPKNAESKGIRWNRGATYALLASFFWGISYTLFKLSASSIGAIPLAFILECCVTCTALVWILISEDLRLVFKSTAGNLKHYLILAVLLVGGTLFFNLAIQQIPVLVLNILGYFTVFVSITTAIIFYKEKLSKRQVLGIILILLSIILIHFSG